MFKTLKTTLVPALFALTLAHGAGAQCITPDNLDGGPCCDRTQVKLPQFPAFQQELLDICWLDCDVEKIRSLVVHWSSPNSGMVSPCDGLRSIVRMRDSAGALIWIGKVNLTYGRTWAENPSGTQQTVQVWRFLVNGDLRPTAAAGAQPCPVPPCKGLASKRVRYTGYVDWAFNCQTGAWSNAWMLTHACDRFEHIPGFPRSGAYHPERAYTFVGPAATFHIDPGVGIETGGGNMESMRSVERLGGPGSVPIAICRYEETANHQLGSNALGCGCSPNGSSGQFNFANLFVQGSCGSQAVTGATQLIPGFVSMSIGEWVDPTVYPGQEALRWNVGEYTYEDGCTAVVRPELFFGATTLGGYQARSIVHTGVGVPLPLTFIDQANSINRKGHTSGNVPFRSNHIINLNH